MSQNYIEGQLRLALQAGASRGWKETTVSDVTRSLLVKVLEDEVHERDILLSELRRCLHVGSYQAATSWIETILDAIEILDRCEGLDSAIVHRLLRVRSLLTDEMILVIRRSREDIDRFKTECVNRWDEVQLSLCDVGARGRPDAYFDIEFKSEFKKRSDQYEKVYKPEGGELVSLVVQCLFVVRFKDKVYYTLHDRSFSGAEDNLSKYSLITGRLSVTDLSSAWNTDNRIQLRTLCKNGLRRVLHKAEELGLSARTAEDYLTKTTPEEPAETKDKRAEFIGIFEDEKGKVLSCLYAIFITPEEYDDIVRRGPYLIPVTQRELTSLRALGLLNDILHKNSCNLCDSGELIPGIDQGRGITATTANARCRSKPGSPCIVRSVDNALSKRKDIAVVNRHSKDYQEKRIIRNGVRTDGDTVIISLDIPDYPLLDAKTISLIRDQLQKLIQTCLPIDPIRECGYKCRIQTTPQGYIIILQKTDGQHVDRVLSPAEAKSREASIALVAYFFSVYMLMKLASLRGWRGRQSEIPEVRVGLHTDHLGEVPGRLELLLSRKSINDAVRIMEFGHEGQILGSQNYILQLLTEIQRYFEISQTGKATEIEARFVKESGEAVRSLQREKSKEENEHGIWDPDALGKLLDALAFPPLVRMEICEHEDIAKCFSEVGLPIIDFGHYTDESDFRRRLFSLGVGMPFIQPETCSGQIPPMYGRPESPIVRVPIIQRSRNTTDEERQKLIDSLQFAEHITCYGYSNIRMLRKIYSDYVASKRGLEHLKQLKVIFYAYEQFQDINETNPQVVAQVHWIMGFMYANWIAEWLRSNARETEVPKVSVSINTIRYGFNVFKVTYAASTDYEDNIRFTVPMPGRSFELSPVFVIKRGAPLYHGFTEICERYIEQGKIENSNDICVNECRPSIPPLVQRLFEDSSVVKLESCEENDEARASLSDKLGCSSMDLLQARTVWEEWLRTNKQKPFDPSQLQLTGWIAAEYGPLYTELCKDFIEEIYNYRWADAYRLLECCKIHHDHFAANTDARGKFLSEFGV